MRTTGESRTIRQLRTAARLTQRQLAAAIGASHMSVYHWESGRNEPSARQLKALARVFAVPMETIAFEKDLVRGEHELDDKRGHS